MARDFTVRRVPRQERGERRVTAILDAAAALMGEVGYDAMTVSAVAARAHVPIGSVYQFFPTKEAITQAVAERYLRDVRALLDTALTIADAHLPFPALMDRLIDPYAAFVAAHPGFVAVLANSKALKQLPATVALEDELVRRVTDLFTARGGAIDPVGLPQLAVLVTKIVGGLVPLAITADGSSDAAMIGAIKEMIAGYLARQFDAAPGEEAGNAP